jgi:glycosyltransferase involved in cell wall biosynthesis
MTSKTDSPVSISVLVANFNHARFLGKTLQAIVDQTRPPEEVIVVDDCSTDDSVAVIDSFRPVLPELRLIRNPENLGVNRTFNRALNEARSNYISFCSADDWFEPVCLQKLADAVEKLNHPRLCLSRFVQFIESEDRWVHHGENSEIGHWYVSETEGPYFFSPEDLRGILRRGYTWLSLNGSLIHRDTLRRIGGYDPNLRWHADWFAVFTIAFRLGFAIVPQPLSVFRLSSENYSASMRDPAQQRQVCRAIFDKLHDPAFADIGEAVQACPAILAPFIRHFILWMAGRPETWPFLWSPLLWWLNEVRKGRRPGMVRDFARSLGVNTNPRL